MAGDWRAAAAAWRALGCPYEQALALADSTAQDDLLAALDLLERLGARPAADTVAARLRELGVRRRPRRPRRATLANPAGLTARELDVLALLGQGPAQRRHRRPAAHRRGGQPAETPDAHAAFSRVHALQTANSI